MTVDKEDTLGKILVIQGNSSSGPMLQKVLEKAGLGNSAAAKVLLRSWRKLMREHRRLSLKIRDRLTQGERQGRCFERTP